jgi:hypothetical protein
MPVPQEKLGIFLFGSFLTNLALQAKVLAI